MEGGISLSKYIQKFNNLIQELESLDMKFDDEDKYLLLLHSLSLFFDGPITTLIYEKDTLEYQNIAQF